MADELTPLAKFTPASVNRDALLFTAGRASAPSRRPWQAATALLLVAQVVTLTARLTPRTPAPLPSPEPTPVVPVAPTDWPDPPPSSYLALRAHLGEPWQPSDWPAAGSPRPDGKPFGVRSSLD